MGRLYLIAMKSIKKNIKANAIAFDFTKPQLPSENEGIIYYGDDCIIGPNFPPTILVGETGIGKSVLAVDIAVNIASGRELPDKFCARENTHVLYIASDGAENNYQKYLCGAASYCNFSNAEGTMLNKNFKFIYTVPEGTPRGDKNPYFEELRQLIANGVREFRDQDGDCPVLVVIDNLQPFFVSEILNIRYAGKLVDYFTAISRELKVGFILVTHTPKNGAKRGAQSSLGASTLANRAYAVANFYRDAKMPSLAKLEFSKCLDNTLYFTKSNESDKSKAYWSHKAVAPRTKYYDCGFDTLPPTHSSELMEILRRKFPNKTNGQLHNIITNLIRNNVFKPRLKGSREYVGINYKGPSAAGSANPADGGESGQPGGMETPAAPREAKPTPAVPAPDNRQTDMFDALGV